MFQRLRRVVWLLLVISSLMANTARPTPAQVHGGLQFSSSNYVAGEPGGTVTITITRTGGTSGAVSALVTTTNGTALAGTDYTALTATTGLVSFADGVAS